MLLFQALPAAYTFADSEKQNIWEWVSIFYVFPKQIKMLRLRYFLFEVFLWPYTLTSRVFQFSHSLQWELLHILFTLSLSVWLILPLPPLLSIAPQKSCDNNKVSVWKEILQKLISVQTNTIPTYLSSPPLSFSYSEFHNQQSEMGSLSRFFWYRYFTVYKNFLLSLLTFFKHKYLYFLVLIF